MTKFVMERFPELKTEINNEDKKRQDKGVKMKI
jgi:hypothetical protein